MIFNRALRMNKVDDLESGHMGHMVVGQGYFGH